MSETPVDVVRHAERVATLLEEFIGLLFSARTSGAMWGVLARRHPVAAAHAFIMSEGVIFITIRRFDDLWKHHVVKLLDPADLGFDRGEQLIIEIAERNLRKTANTLFAHYAEQKSDRPLSHADVDELLHSNGWQTEQELLDWSGHALRKIAVVLAAVLAKYSLPGEPKEWMLGALDDINWMTAQIAERYDASKPSPT